LRKDQFITELGIKFQRNLPPVYPPLGISQVSDLAFDTRCSQPPRIARQLHKPVASLSMTDCHLRKVDRNHWCNDAESPCFPTTRTWRCGWHLCPSESHPRRLLNESVAGLHVKQAIYMITSQVTS